MSYIILPNAVQQQPVRCNSRMPTCQGQVWAPEHYYRKTQHYILLGQLENGIRDRVVKNG